MDFDIQGDGLANLPTDVAEPKSREMQILDRLFNDKDFSDTVDSKFKGVVIASVLFFVVSLPFLTKIIVSFFPSSKNEYVALILKTFIFMVFYFIAQKAFLNEP